MHCLSQTYLCNIASTSDLLRPGNTLNKTSTGDLCAGYWGWKCGNCGKWWYCINCCVCCGGVSGLEGFFNDKFSGASLSLSSSTSKSGSGLVVGSGDGVGTNDVGGCEFIGDVCLVRLISSWSESDSSNGQSSELNLGLFIPVIKYC